MNESSAEKPSGRDDAIGGTPGLVGTPPSSYETAAARIEAIIRRLDSGEAGLRETLDLVKEGRTLVEYCAAELAAVSHGLEELRLEELVSRLEGNPANPGQPIYPPQESRP